MRKKIYIGALFFLIFDLFTKFLISSYVDNISIINNFFSITYVENTGGAFSLFSSYTYILAIIGIAVLIYLDRKYISDKLSKISVVAMMFLIGGISGNIIDRIIHGYVVDFLSFKIFGYSFPVFNVADICICCGALLFIIDMIRGGINECKSR